MPARRLRWGILGTARINRRLLPAFRASSTADLVAIASRSKEKADAAAKAAGIPRAYGSYEELLASDVDAVYLPLPNELHVEWAQKAADAGKHILCEKPLAPTAGQAAALVQYCREKKVRLMDGFMWPHHPRTAKLRKYLDEGHIGQVEKVNAAFTFKLDGLPLDNIRMKPPAGGGLLDVGCYCVYAIRWWMGADPVSALARAEYVNGVDVSLNGMLTFPNGRTCNFDCGFTDPYRTWVEIVGATGMAWLADAWLPDEQAAFEVHRADGDRGMKIETVATPGEDQIVHLLDDFAAAVFEGRDPVPKPVEAVRNSAVMDALLLSARSGKECEIKYEACANIN